jgi:hypothetical protein
VSTCSTGTTAVPSSGLPPPEKIPDTAVPQLGQNLLSEGMPVLQLGQARVVAAVMSSFLL